jgi:hypothetical protein
VKLLAELKRRNVFRLAGLYLVSAWLIIQVAETVLPVFGVSDAVLRTLFILLALGFLPAVVVSWIYELTAQGLVRDEDAVPENADRSSRPASAAATGATGPWPATRPLDHRRARPGAGLLRGRQVPAFDRVRCALDRPLR